MGITFGATGVTYFLNLFLRLNPRELEWRGARVYKVSLLLVPVLLTGLLPFLAIWTNPAGWPFFAGSGVLLVALVNYLSNRLLRKAGRPVVGFESWWPTALFFGIFMLGVGTWLHLADEFRILSFVGYGVSAVVVLVLLQRTTGLIGGLVPGGEKWPALVAPRLLESEYRLNRSRSRSDADWARDEEG